MTIEELTKYAKKSKRISTDAFDDEIKNLIDEAIDDINRSCEHKFNINNLGDCRMVVLYVRAMFGSGDEKAYQLYQDRLKIIGTRKLLEEDTKGDTNG